MYDEETISAQRTHLDGGVTIRLRTPADEGAIRRLAQLDSARVPEGPSLIALRGETLRAGISLATGDTVADPFHRTGELVELLRMRAAQLGRPRRRLGARLLALARGERHVASQPPGSLRPEPAREGYRLIA
jgi:hypothetical protein